MAGAVNIDDAHSLAYFIAAKQQAAFPSPNEFNSYASLAQIDLYKYYNDEREKQWLKGKEGQSWVIPPVLSNFVVFGSPITMTANMIDMPDDYLYDLEMVSSPSVGNQVYIKKVDYSKITNYINSTIDPPTYINPIFSELPESFVAYPSGIPNISLTYLQAPTDPFWNYSLVNGRPVYNPAGSVDFQFDSSEIYRLVSRILKYFGISIRDIELAQEAQQMVQGAS